jgi:hypothetical protein
MQNAAGGGTSAPTEYPHGAIVSDLMSLITHVQASMELIERAIPDEAPLGYWETGANIFVLDDVTPRYASVRAALQTCEAHRGAALLLLHAARAPQPRIKAAAAAPQPVRWSGCALGAR